MFAKWRSHRRRQKAIAHALALARRLENPHRVTLTIPIWVWLPYLVLWGLVLWLVFR